MCLKAVKTLNRRGWKGIKGEGKKSLQNGRKSVNLQRRMVGQWCSITGRTKFLIMAKVIYGGVGLQGLSGSINKQAGGHTFTKNNVVRRRVVPTNPQSEEQTLVRAAFSFLTTAWSGLAESERSAWEAARTDPYYATQDKLNGVSKAMNSGKSLFVAMNMNNLQAIGALNSPTVIFTVPAEPEALDSISAVSVALDASANTTTLTYTGTWTGETGFIKMTPPVSAGNMKASTVSTRSRIIGEDFGTSPVDLSSDYSSRFGLLSQAAGKKVFWELYGVNNTTGKKRLIASGVSVVAA